MKEVITLQIGGFGNTLANMFFEDLYLEQSISISGHINHAESPANSFPEVFLTENQKFIYNPRSIIIDTDPSQESSLNAFPINSKVPSKFKLFGSCSTQRNFAKGRSEKELIDRILEACRKQAEICESLQGFQFFHSIGGGTGSGLVSEVMNELIEYDSRKNFVNFVGFPSSKISELPQESINACLAMNSLIDSSQLTVCLDNCKLFESVSRLSAFKGFSDINSIMRQQVSDFTSLLRLPGNHFSTYKKIETFFTPFQRLHFLMINSSYEIPTERDRFELMMKTLDPVNIFYQNDLGNARSYASILLSRGSDESRKEKSVFNSWFKSNKMMLVEWIKSNSVFHSIKTPNSHTSRSFSFIQNSQNIRNLFLRLSQEFVYITKEKAHIESYLKQCIDEMELIESNITDLYCQYAPCCDACSSEGDSFGYEEEEF